MGKFLVYPARALEIDLRLIPVLCSRLSVDGVQDFDITGISKL
jgi:hypothetical protein